MEVYGVGLSGQLSVDFSLNIFSQVMNLISNKFVGRWSVFVEQLTLRVSP